MPIKRLFGVSSGKWYWEVKVNTKGASGYGWKSDSNVGGSQAADTGGSIGTVYNVGGSGGFADGEWTDDYSNGYSNFSPFTTAKLITLLSDTSTWPSPGTGSLIIGISAPILKYELKSSL